MRKISANEILDVLNSQWATVDDVMMIGSIGKSKARDVMKEIRTEVEEEGFRLPQIKLVPMDKVIKYFNINVSYLKKVARDEKSIPTSQPKLCKDTE